jgi:hypothetical protein
MSIHKEVGDISGFLRKFRTLTVDVDVRNKEREK